MAEYLFIRWVDRSIVVVMMIVRKTKNSIRRIHNKFLAFFANKWKVFYTWLISRDILSLMELVTVASAYLLIFNFLARQELIFSTCLGLLKEMIVVENEFI